MIERIEKKTSSGKPAAVERFTCDQCGKVICPDFDGEIQGIPLYEVCKETGLSGLISKDIVCGLPCLHKAVDDYFSGNFVEYHMEISKVVI